MVRWDSNPRTLGSFPPSVSPAKLLTKPFGKTDGYVYHLRLEFVFTIFPFFFERFPLEVMSISS